MVLFKFTGELSSSLVSLLLAMISAMCMAVPVLFQDYEILGWIGLIPFLFALQRGSVVRAFALGFVFGFVYVAISSYWVPVFLDNFNQLKGASAFVISLLFWGYSALPYALGLALYRWCTRKSSVLNVLVLPVCIVACTATYPQMFEPHFSLGQIRNLVALQALDVVGVYGADFVIVLANAIAFKLSAFCVSSLSRFSIDQTSSCPYSTCFLDGLSLIILYIWFSYGIVKLGTFQELVDVERASVRVGIVQPNDSLPEQENAPVSPYSWSFPQEMESALVLAERGADLIIWPEAKSKGYFDKPIVAFAFHQQTKMNEFDLLFHDTQTVMDESEKKEFSSAVLVTHLGEAKISRKSNLIPIAEYLPEYLHYDGLRLWLAKTFGSFISAQSPGESTPLTLSNGVEVLPLICYDILFNHAFLKQETESDRHRIISVLSNDIWFENTRATHQHSAYAVLRAIEYRLPLIHVVNNGPSVLIAPSGHIKWQSEAFNDGEYIVDVEAVRNLAVVSKSFSEVFLWVNSIVLIYLIARPIARPRATGLAVTK